jgi:hypothetical protein
MKIKMKKFERYLDSGETVNDLVAALRDVAGRIERKHALDVVVMRPLVGGVQLLCPRCLVVNCIATAGTLLEWNTLTDFEIDEDGHLTANASIDRHDYAGADDNGYVCTACSQPVKLDVTIIDYIGG